MLIHIVLFRRKPGVRKQPELERKLVRRMQDLEKQIEGVLRWKLAANELERPVSWDYVLVSGFADVDGLNARLQHPAHVELIADLKPYFEWAACDYTDQNVAV